MIKYFILFLLLTFSLPTWSFRLSPMNSTFLIDKSEKAKIFRISNDSDEKIAVQVTLAKRIMDEAGKETTPEVEDFLVFPSQIILPPKSKRSVKVQWLNKFPVKGEHAYRIIAEQLPIELSKEKQKNQKGNLKILLKYVGALYVSNTSFSPKINVESSKVVAIAKKNMLELLIHNQGNAHQVLKDVTIVVKQGKQKISLSTEQELTGLMGENVLAGQKRRFTITCPKQLNPKKPISVEISFKST